MPRTARSIEAGTVHHVLHRGNGRMRLFHEDGDYEAFERVLTEGFSCYPVDRRPVGPPIHPPRSRPVAEDAKQSVRSPFLPCPIESRIDSHFHRVQYYGTICGISHFESAVASLESAA